MAARMIGEDDVRKFVPSRRRDSRKGENGKVLVVGGSYIYHGAPIFSSVAALRSGCDLVYTAVPKINAPATRAASPSMIVIPLADQKLTRGAARKLAGQIPTGLDSATIGMGLAIAERSALKVLVVALVDMDVRISLDAGALVREILGDISGKNCLVTPHAGEFKRLFGESPPADIEGRASMVERLAQEHGITILLKGPTDVISDGNRTLLNDRGAPAMTVGGTGDVLSGIAAGILARNRSPLESAAAAAYINGLAGEAAQEMHGLHITAMDLCELLPSVMKPFDRLE
uniref:ADP-dependent (S)-NAD(P)H-hydrate dehydratase n=1 Tax=Cenarchaeum symbiosum (strain A) TaxID=414004 RepID=NNRD_CENSY|nr:RecName: Full=ADP-dependent (S)-NAD(P)H-hydrate dehydratase; AltName: Full=ADP-dependent NAD(P)HX dehydratase [Cenarchaeum symbiosum A]